jgi:glycosyltransferase involved in cell wall biosynthesis
MSSSEDHLTKLKSPKISVVICTYNRVELLSHVLSSVTVQTVPTDEYEILVIDNHSTDNTKEFVIKFSQIHPNVRYIYEPEQGLSHARNRGWKEAQGEYVAYIDDDARAENRWVEAIAAFAARRPEAAAFGGPYFGFSLKPLLQAWYKESYASWSLGTEERPIQKDEWLKGTNMIYKRTALEALNGFDTRLGMSGKTLAYGEEVGLQLKLMEKGFPIYYVPCIRVKHLIADYKLELPWFLKSIYYRGYSSYEALGFQKSTIHHMLKTIYALIKGIGKFIVSRESDLKARFVDSFYHFLWQAGLTVRMFKG